MRTPGAIDLSPLTQARTTLIALDFDGVIAPLQDDPATSAPLPASAEAVRALSALPLTPVGFISGRDLAVLRTLSRAPEPTLFIGSHGLETDFSALEASSATAFFAPLTEEERGALAALDAALERIAAEDQGGPGGPLRIERKPLGRTAHTRGLPAARAAHLTARLRELAEAMPRLRSFAGHDMTEFAVRMETKGDGLERMIAATGAEAVLFIGDDVTDEDAFARLQRSTADSVAVKVGEADTLAPLRIADPEAVAELLGRLAVERAAALH
ncbi:trehalose-phosphatase [Brevibacterium album]|uniref:trehalose-phosphatase n=1 Tax=Brevibacterium album TaxID=417948 RepID=UPI00048CF434|nr:trehalose-phosphatase [Brevibacterium album]